MKRLVVTFIVVLISFHRADAARTPISSEGGAAGVYSGVKLTAYSANCPHDSYGGPNGSPSKLKPRSHTVDGPSPVVLVAVPQMGGTKSLVGCFLEMDFSRSTVPPKMRKMFESKMYFAGDHYGRGSDGMAKADISYECRPGLQNYTFKNVRVKKGKCVKNWRTKDSQVAVAEAIRNHNTGKGTLVAGPIKTPEIKPPAIATPPRGSPAVATAPVQPSPSAPATRPTAAAGRPRIPTLRPNSPAPHSSVVTRQHQNFSSNLWIEQAFGTR